MVIRIIGQLATEKAPALGVLYLVRHMGCDPNYAEHGIYIQARTIHQFDEDEMLAMILIHCTCLTPCDADQNPCLDFPRQMIPVTL
jgi:hypothetical protein